jgi:2-oxoglutarate dehydrogenase E2 component (dihydrolipoamide succinyltransferase)
MPTEVKVPAMGESISSGILAAWHVKDGDHVEKDQPIYELETDKITSEANAEVAGVISIRAEEGAEVEIGQVVATIDESAAGEAAKAKKEEPAKEAPAEKEEPAEPGTRELKNSGTAPSAALPLSPAARKAAEETGVDPSTIEGTGKDGRVTKGDILARSQETGDGGQGSGDRDQETGGRRQESGGRDQEDAAAPQAPSHAASERGARETRRKMSPLRRKIADRLVTACNEAALLTTFNEVDMSAVMQLRKQHQETFVEKHGVKLGFMSFFAKAVTHALQTVPAVNARIEGEEIVSQHYYDIGVAVGTDKGLMVPVVRDCDRKSFAEIEKDILGYARAARDGKIKIEDLEGGVFTISNGGIYGSMLSTPIVNHPQPAILGLHNIQQRPVVVEGEIVARPMMYLALSYDHRLIDGKEAVTFLLAVKHAIEDPARMLFGL